MRDLSFINKSDNPPLFIDSLYSCYSYSDKQAYKVYATMAAQARLKLLNEAAIRANENYYNGIVKKQISPWKDYANMLAVCDTLLKNKNAAILNMSDNDFYQFEYQLAYTQYLLLSHIAKGISAMKEKEQKKNQEVEDWVRADFEKLMKMAKEYDEKGEYIKAELLYRQAYNLNIDYDGKLYDENDLYLKYMIVNDMALEMEQMKNSKK